MAWYIRHDAGVAGVQTPAFVERSSTAIHRVLRAAVSPGFRLRPSLSVLDLDARGIGEDGVAGVQTPAFVERVVGGYARAEASPGVAGVQTPAFVERSPRSPNSGVTTSCRRGSDSGLR